MKDLRIEIALLFPLKDWQVDKLTEYVESKLAEAKRGQNELQVMPKIAEAYENGVKYMYGKRRIIDNYWLGKCLKCGWIGLTDDCNGNDDDNAYCPKCAEIVQEVDS